MFCHFLLCLICFLYPFFIFHLYFDLSYFYSLCYALSLSLYIYIYVCVYVCVCVCVYVCLSISLSLSLHEILIYKKQITKIFNVLPLVTISAHCAIPNQSTTNKELLSDLRICHHLFWAYFIKLYTCNKVSNLVG